MFPLLGMHPQKLKLFAAETSAHPCFLYSFTEAKRGIIPVSLDRGTSSCCMSITHSGALSSHKEEQTSHFQESGCDCSSPCWTKYSKLKLKDNCVTFVRFSREVKYKGVCEGCGGKEEWWVRAKELLWRFHHKHLISMINRCKVISGNRQFDLEPSIEKLADHQG